MLEGMIVYKAMDKLYKLLSELVGSKILLRKGKANRPIKKNSGQGFLISVLGFLRLRKRRMHHMMRGVGRGRRGAWLLEKNFGEKNFGPERAEEAVFCRCARVSHTSRTIVRMVSGDITHMIRKWASIDATKMDTVTREIGCGGDWRERNGIPLCYAHR